MLVACSACKVDKPPTAFRKNSSAKGRFREHGIHNECRECDSASHAKYYAKNKRKIADSTLRRKYGIGIDDYERMADEQGHRCALCQEPEAVSNRKLAVDHDHETGRVRGLLCFKCNTALGRVADTGAALRRLVSYVESCQ